MAEGCCASIIKTCLFIFNFIFWVAGAVLLGVGIWLRVDPGVAQVVSGELNMTWFYNACYVLIAAGVITMIVGFLGCCGAIKESKCMLMTFAILLGLLFVIELAAGILAIVYKDKVGEYARQSFTDALAGETIESKNDDFQSAVRGIQSKFTCCGLTATNNWALPCLESTCVCNIITQTGCKAVISVPPCAVHQPCLTEFESFLANNIVIVAGVALAIAIVQIIGICCACVLMRNIYGETIA
ncbi:tetraspanin-8-like [Branchiostoma floridae x Branchiostoma japonicum]